MRCSINRVILFALLCALLVGCRRNEAVVVIPTLSPTPRSTALPPIATRVPVGSQANPIQVAVVGSSEEDTAALDEALTEAAELSVQIVSYEQPAQALAALCDAASNAPTAAWLDGLTALAAQAQGCGDITLAVEQGGSTTIAYQLIGSSEIETPTALVDEVFCRVSVTDRATWLYPSLLLQAANVDLTSFSEIVDYENVDALITAVLDGDCAGAGVPVARLESLTNTQRRNLTIFDDEVNIPHSVLVYSQTIPLGEREALDTAFINLLSDETQGEALQSLLSADALRPSDSLDFESLRDLIDALGLDLAQLGR